MEKLESMKECLIGMVESQIYGNIDKVDTQELGAAVDMIKDLSEAIYYCTITKAMEEGEEEKESKGKHGMMYSRSTPTYHMPYPVEMYDPRYRERYNYSPMYAQNSGGNDGNSSSNGGSMGSSNSRAYHEGRMPIEYPEHMKRDPKEGRSGERRKMYMESKYMKDKTHQMQELENYMQELSTDITEMIADASPEEKQMLSQKIGILAAKIK